MARRERTPKGPSWPSWFYGPNGESAIFQSEDEVPEGWGRKPGIPEPKIIYKSTKVLNRDELVAELAARNIPINPTWGNAHMKRIIDGDISTSR